MLQLLLVDDEEYVVDDLQIAFPWSQYGIERVHKAYSGTHALQIIDSNSIDIVITDIAMPGMNGLQLISQIRSRDLPIKCILLTGYAEFDYAKEAIRHQVSEYLIKPLDFTKLSACLEATIHAMKEDLERTVSQERAVATFLNHLPLLKDRLLNDLLQGKHYSAEVLMNKLADYSLPYGVGDDIYLLLIRLEEHFSHYGLNSLLLFEYAVTNIACELFEDHFEVWHCRDSYDYLVFVLKPKMPADAQSNLNVLHNQLTHRSLKLHHNVNEYLKGGISVILTYRGQFFVDIPYMYEQSVSALRKQIGNETGYFTVLVKQPEPSSVHSLHILYESPSFIHLLESGQWESFKERLRRIEAAFCSSSVTEEHLDEIKSAVLTAFYYISHKDNAFLSDLVERDLLHRPSFRSLSQLIEWAGLLSDMLRSKLDKDTLNLQQEVIQKIQDYIGLNLGTVSLQSISDHINFHPVYVSKLFRQTWGTTLSEYILKVKMEQAVMLLRHSTDKIYEISEKLGYSNSQYFIKVFKEQHWVTPQDYRDKSLVNTIDQRKIDRVT
jgi:two-component system response regulator YesN